MTSFDIKAWSIVPGPLSIRPPFESTELIEIEQYLPSSVARLVLAIPSVELIHPEQPRLVVFALSLVGGFLAH